MTKRDLDLAIVDVIIVAFVMGHIRSNKKVHAVVHKCGSVKSVVGDVVLDRDFDISGRIAENGLERRSAGRYRGAGRGWSVDLLGRLAALELQRCVGDGSSRLRCSLPRRSTVPLARLCSSLGPLRRGIVLMVAPVVYLDQAVVLVR